MGVTMHCRGTLDDPGSIVAFCRELAIYPANTLEHHPEYRNPTSVIAGLTCVLNELITLPVKYTSEEKRKRWQGILDTLPEMPTGHNPEYGGTYLKPAADYEHRSWHCPEMYPLFPYELHAFCQYLTERNPKEGENDD